ncbi:MAG TPA: FecR domain-containing protein [Polyangium sp.]|nr:FecR domain-containing protein [Polyangium sp.]
MNRHRCERTWQAEAREDGRLESRDLASFERHAAHCPDCADEIAVLRDITRKMSELPEPKRTELEHRRARQDLLRRANERFLAEKPAARPWKNWVLAGAVALGAWGLYGQYSGRTPTHVPVFDVANMTNAVWQTETIASTSRVTLQSGTAAFHVERLAGEERFLVDMPDGHIEVRGTRFIVDVADGKTRSVVVTEGKVWLDVPHFHGLLQAGDHWPQIESAANTAESLEEAKTPVVIPIGPTFASAEVPTIASPTNSALPSTPASPQNGAAPSSPEQPAENAAPVASASALPKDEAGPRFAEAMSAFTGGDEARADQLFANFIRDFPRDGRAEDAMFLRAKSRARRGDSAGAAAIARDYLKIYPRGFRRPEAERLAGENK